MFNCVMSARKLINRFVTITIAVALIMTTASTLVACNKQDSILHSSECIVEITNGSSGEILGEEEKDISRYCIQEDEFGNNKMVKQYLKQFISKVTSKNILNIGYIFNGAYADTSYEIEGFYTTEEKCYWYNITASADDENTKELYNMLNSVCWDNEHYRYIVFSCSKDSKLPQGSDYEWDFGTVKWCENHQMANSETRAKMLSYLKEYAHVDAQDVVLFQSWIGIGECYQVYAKVNDTWYEGYIPTDVAVPLTVEEEAQLRDFSESIHTAYLQSDAFAEAIKDSED